MGKDIKWIEIKGKSSKEILEILEQNPTLKIKLNNATNSIPEIKKQKEIIETFIKKHNLKGNENIKEMIEMRTKMHNLLVKYGFIVLKEEKEWGIFGPDGRPAQIVSATPSFNEQKPSILSKIKEFFNLF